MTATLETETTETVRHALFFKDAEPLIRALTNGILFADTSRDAMPVLACIRFEFGEGCLNTVSTDRYRLCAEPVELHTGMDQTGLPGFDFLLPVASAKAALSMLKGVRRQPVTLTYDPTAGTVKFEALESKVATSYPQAAVTLVTFGRNKPTLCRYADGPTVLLMPVRIAG